MKRVETEIERWRQFRAVIEERIREVEEPYTTNDAEGAFLWVIDRIDEQLRELGKIAGG